MLCDAMKWNHLPMAGGLYDQDPELLDRFYHIFAERSKEQAKELAKRNRESGAAKQRVAGRRR